MSGSNNRLIVYGCGGVGRQIVDELIDNDVDVELIVDRGFKLPDYRGIPVKPLEAAVGELGGRSVLIGLHNHYVDVRKLRGELLEAGAGRVLSAINLPMFVKEPRTRPGYWLDYSFDYAASDQSFGCLRSLLADEKSRDLLDSIIRYRSGGDLGDCPMPTLDEYTPEDLPRYAGPLHLLDCGAYTGVAIHKFLKAGYELDSIVAFEPDPPNYAILASRTFPARRVMLLPLATWSSTTQLRFGSQSSASSYRSDDGNTTVQASGASHLNEDGNVLVQCVAIDDLMHGQPVNLVKLDVEGAEIETLKGMERLIREQRPNLLLSAYHTPGHLHEIADLIADWDLGYRFHLRVHEYNTFGVVLYCLQDGLVE